MGIYVPDSECPVKALSSFCSLLPIKPGDENSSQKSSRLSKEQKETFSVTPELKEILTGLLLGDLFAEKRSGNIRLRFEQGIIHTKYLIHLYTKFEEYCPAGPKTISRGPDNQEQAKFIALSILELTRYLVLFHFMMILS